MAASVLMMDLKTDAISFVVGSGCLGCVLSLVVGVDSFVEESQLWNLSMLLFKLPFLCGLWQQFYPYFLLSTVRETGVLETLRRSNVSEPVFNHRVQLHSTRDDSSAMTL